MDTTFVKNEPWRHS